MSAARDLIRELEAAGGRLRIVGGGLKVKPRDLPGDLLDRLRAHKPELLAFLAWRDRRGRFRAAHAGPTGSDPASWQRWVANEAERHRRFGRTPAEADRAAFREALNCWHGRSNRPIGLIDSCAGCHRPLEGGGIHALPDGAMICGDATRLQDCILAYERIWKPPAIAALAALGITAPEAPEGGTP